jgi:putative methyltransferase
LVAVSPCVDLLNSEAYKSGVIIFQDKASCFPAYLLDPLLEDGDVIDSCSAPGNKTTHLAAILLSHNSESDECNQKIHAFEKNKGRAKTLEKMVKIAGSDVWTTLHPGQDFLKTSPGSPMFKDVGALLLDPSCSGSGIVGRDDMPPLHLPALEQAPKASKKGAKKPDKSKETRKRKREEDEDLIMVDDDGLVTSVDTGDELKTRLAALSAFQLELLLHAFKFPAARKITYSTCSIHSEENESVVQRALTSEVAKQQGWRILKRGDQIRGMRGWPVRGSVDACGEDDEVAEACIRANKGDEHGTMGFFLAGFVRDLPVCGDADAQFLRDERGHLVRDLLGFPVRADAAGEKEDASGNGPKDGGEREDEDDEQGASEEEWNGFSDND